MRLLLRFSAVAVFVLLAPLAQAADPLPDDWAFRAFKRPAVPQGSAHTLLAALPSVPAERRASWRMHKVESGETLAMIGKRYGASPSVIAAVNRMESEMIGTYALQ